MILETGSSAFAFPLVTFLIILWRVTAPENRGVRGTRRGILPHKMFFSSLVLTVCDEISYIESTKSPTETRVRADLSVILPLAAKLNSKKSQILPHGNPFLFHNRPILLESIDLVTDSSGIRRFSDHSTNLEWSHPGRQPAAGPRSSCSWSPWQVGTSL